jgi:hypothetical protein
MQTPYIRKTIEVNRHFLETAKDILKTKTDKETVNRALEIISDEHEIIKAHIEAGGAGEIRRVFK